MERRRFLGLAGGAAVGAGAVLAGCSSGSSDGDRAADAPTTTAAPAETTTTVTDRVPGVQGLAGPPFTLGVASGDPLPRAVVLWTRLAPEPLDPTAGFGVPDRDVDVRWEVAHDDEFAEVVASGIATATPAHGHSIHVDVTGLEPDTWYRYRFQVGPHTSPVGRTRTAPADRATVDQLRFAFVSCQNRSSGHWTAYDHLADDEPDLVFHLGDYIYEYPGGEGATKVPLDHEPETLADYRVLYAGYKGDPKLQRAHQVAPWVVTWDDHEVQNNYAAAVPQGDDDADAFAERRRAAYQAYWEHQPLRAAPPAADGALQVYRTLRWGSLATFFVLDGRQFRTDQVCGDEIPTIASTCPELDDDAHTMLGTRQEAWLARGLRDVDTTWTGLAQQTVMKALVLGDVVLNVDQWDGYPAARRRLFDSIRRAGVENVVVMTGDIHAAGAADLRLPDAGPARSDTGDGPIVAHELVGTSISSRGLGALAGGGLDTTPIGLPYANFADHGYVRCTVTPQRWRGEFVMVDTIEQPTSDAHVDATVDIRAGTPGIRVSRA